MKLRRLMKGDLDRIRQLHEDMKMPYELPDFEDGTFVGELVIEDDDGIPVMFLAARRVTEMFFLFDQDYETPGFRFELFKKISAVMNTELSKLGVAYAHALLPPKLEKSFGRRLLKLGWSRPLWPLFAWRIR